MENRARDAPRFVSLLVHTGPVLLVTLVLVAAMSCHLVSLAAERAAMSRLYLPSVSGEACAFIPTESYATVAVGGSHPSLPAEVHPDLNLAVRGYAPTIAELQPVDYGGSADPRAPQLAGLLSGGSPPFGSAYQIFDWDWAGMGRGTRISDPPVTVLGFRVHRGETLHVPASGYTIGEGWEVLVLYASSERVTLKYTREDSVVEGYTLHVENACVEPRLLSLYRSCDASGRNRLPALRELQAFGRARSDQVLVAIRDHGRFLDPRSRKDWWQGF